MFSRRHLVLGREKGIENALCIYLLSIILDIQCFLRDKRHNQWPIVSCYTKNLGVIKRHRLYLNKTVENIPSSTNGPFLSAGLAIIDKTHRLLETN